jgi:hypothetical protein
MDKIRLLQGNLPLQYELTECFWESQLISKEAVVEAIRWTGRRPTSIVVFGGWYGLLAQMLDLTFPQCKIISVDIRPACAIVGRELLPVRSQVEFDTCDMAEYKYGTDLPDWVINTSTEHVTQETYDKWFDRIPLGTRKLIQGNDFFECKDHIRCSTDMTDFVTMNRMRASSTKSIQCNPFTRFMAWV